MPRIVVLGTAHGHIFGLADNARQSPGHELIGVYDNDPERLKSAAARMQIKPLNTLEEALAARPDLALIGAVPSDRVDLAEAAVSAGASVLVDKPLALSFEALERLQAAVRRTGRTISVFYPYRGYPETLAIRRLVREGRIGKIVRILATGPHMLNAATRPAWHWTRRDNGGILIDIGSHYLDACNWLTGEYPAEISAAHVNLDNPEHPEFQDFGHARLVYTSGATAYIEVDWFSPATAGYDTRFWVQGTAGKIELRLGKEPSLRLWTESVAGEAIEVTETESGAQWTTRLIAELAAGRPGDIPQQDVWDASRLSLQAFESAETRKVLRCRP
jgi:predicted dehydrogenase